MCGILGATKLGTGSGEIRCRIRIAFALIKFQKIMNNIRLIRKLCALTGIADAYRDHLNQPRAISDESLAALLAARGFDTESEQALRNGIAELTNKAGEFRVPPVIVLRQDEQPMVSLQVPLTGLEQELTWRLLKEDGSIVKGALTPAEHVLREHDAYAVCEFEIGSSLEPGYHWLNVANSRDASEHRVRVIVAPQSAYGNGENEAREWGVSVQLYALRSRRNWGIGDFTDLAWLAQELAEAGADFLGINPLHALYPSNPEHASPYSPASRAFINYLYIDVEAVPEFASCPAAQDKVASEYFQSRLTMLRECSHVDYSGVAFLKLVILRHLYEHFVITALRQDSERAARFHEFVEEGGAALEQLCLFYALYADHRKASRHGGWRNWPDQFKDPDSEAVAQFAENHADTVRFYMYLQWLADEQLAKAHAAALSTGMRTGLYRDLAVGIDANGADNWRNQDLYCVGASVGAPPDSIALQGQDWGLPPMEPRNMRAEAYETFITDLRDNMRHCGALRLDHVMQLMRLWWTPAGRPSSEGAYVRYPFNDLLGIVTLESHRNRCRIIGEDLGVVPDEIRDQLPRANIWSYKVLLFEKQDEKLFKKPDDYAVRAMATLTTHDLPTLPGYWRGADLLLREELGLFPSLEVKEQTWEERIADRQGLAEALKAESLYPQDLPGEANQIDELPETLLLALETYLARSRSRMVCAQLEDWMGVVDPVNVPGTSEEYPNWRRRLPDNLEDLDRGGRMTRHAAALTRGDEPAEPSDSDSGQKDKSA